MIDTEKLNLYGYMVGCERLADESNNSYLHRTHRIHRQSLQISDVFASMIHDISDIGALVIKIEKNSTWLSTSDIPPQSFRVTVVGGNRNDIARCIYDNRTPGTKSVGDTCGTATSVFGTSTERFNHIEIDYALRAINFMEKWQQIVYDIQEAIEEND